MEMFSDPIHNIEQLSLGSDNYVADFGSGSGTYAFAAAEKTHDGKVYAIDVQKDLLEKLKNESRNRHLLNIEVIWADLDKLNGTKLRSEIIDVVIAANVFFQLESKETACEEIKRIVKREGRVLVIDWLSSFGGLGPEQSSVFNKDDCTKLFEAHGFVSEREISAGANHYGIIFRKHAK